MPLARRRLAKMALRATTTAAYSGMSVPVNAPAVKFPSTLLFL